MNNTRRNNPNLYFSLNLKMALVVVFALIMTLIVFLLTEAFETFIVEKYYMSEPQVEKNVNNAYRDLEEYIENWDIRSRDTEQLQDWLKEQDYTYLVVFDNYSISFEGGWQVFSGNGGNDSGSINADQNPVNQDEQIRARITPETFSQDVKNRIVEFEDGSYYVFINVYREQRFYRIMFFTEIILCVITLIGIILVYNAHVLGRVSKLSVKVEAITAGDIGATIGSTANDEIGRLATNVNVMRNSIVDRLQKEKAAWDANTQLITAMSHDIRTPLTSLIGYLDIIESGKAQTRDEEMRYIDSCREKAFQLRDLSDKLFQYFLVFGSDSKEKKLDVYDGGILLQQLISEHSAELISYGFDIDLDYTVPDVEIEADLSGLRRLFDNISSNIMKYADKGETVRIKAAEEDGNIAIQIINRVLAVSRQVESNKIGLKTCERICQDMNGSFEYTDKDQTFTVKITIPIKAEIVPEAPAPDEGTEKMKVTTDTLVGIDLSGLDLENVMDLENVKDLENMMDPDNAKAAEAGKEKE